MGLGKEFRVKFPVVELRPSDKTSSRELVYSNDPEFLKNLPTKVLTNVQREKVEDQTANEEVLSESEKELLFTLQRLEDFYKLPDKEFFSLMIEVTRLLSSDLSKNESNSFLLVMGKAVLLTRDSNESILSGEYPAETKLLKAVGEKLTARLKRTFNRMYELSRKRNLSPHEHEQLTTFSTLLYSLEETDEISALTSENLYLLGISSYGDLWKVLRILQRAQEIEPSLSAYSLQDISESLLENIDNEDLLETDSEIFDALQASSEIEDQSIISSQKVLTATLSQLFHRVPTQLNFHSETEDFPEELRSSGIDMISTKKNSLVFEIEVVFGSTSVTILLYTMTHTLDWNRLLPFEFSDITEKQNVLQILTNVISMLELQLSKKTAPVLSKPTFASMKGPRREKSSRNSLSFSTPINIVENGSFLDDQKKSITISLANPQDLEKLFPKKMTEKQRDLIKSKLETMTPKFLKKLKYLHEDTICYRYKIQLFRVLLIASNEATESTFKLEVVSVGVRKNFYSKLQL